MFLFDLAWLSVQLEKLFNQTVGSNTTWKFEGRELNSIHGKPYGRFHNAMYSLVIRYCPVRKLSFMNIFIIALYLFSDFNLTNKHHKL